MSQGNRGETPLWIGVSCSSFKLHILRDEPRARLRSSRKFRYGAAYYCEIIRVGIQSIPSGQVSAAKAIGLTYPQRMIHGILPQAFRKMLPILLTQTIILFQDTSLVYVISGTDFLGAASKIAQRDSRLVEMYSFVAVVYFVISFSLSRAVKLLQNKFKVYV